jgi:hypothetical protein
MEGGIVFLLIVFLLVVGAGLFFVLGGAGSLATWRAGRASDGRRPTHTRVHDATDEDRGQPID